jgi:hypothetical protein
MKRRTWTGLKPFCRWDAGMYRALKHRTWMPKRQYVAGRMHPWPHFRGSRPLLPYEQRNYWNRQLEAAREGGVYL